MARYDDLSTGPIAYAAFVSSILLIILILLFRALCYGWVELEDAKKLADAHYTSADAEIGQQKARVSDYSKAMVTVSAPAGSESTGGSPAAEPSQVERLHIPVQRAKEMLLLDLAK